MAPASHLAVTPKELVRLAQEFGLYAEVIGGLGFGWDSLPYFVTYQYLMYCSCTA